MACGVGLFRIAMTAAIATLLILRMGRRKPIHQELRQQFQTSATAVTPTSTRLPKEIQEEVEDEEGAEIHITSVWDEHPHHADEQVEVEDDIAEGNTRNAVRDNDTGNLMEELVRSAWQNPTHDYDTLVPMEQLERHRHSTSKSDYRP